MSEASQEDDHGHDERLRPRTPDEHSGNQDLQAMLHRRQEAERKLQERQEEAGREGSGREGSSGGEESGAVEPDRDDSGREKSGAG